MSVLCAERLSGRQSELCCLEQRERVSHPHTATDGFISSTPRRDNASGTDVCDSPEGGILRDISAGPSRRRDRGARFIESKTWKMERWPREMTVVL